MLRGHGHGNTPTTNYDDLRVSLQELADYNDGATIVVARGAKLSNGQVKVHLYEDKVRWRRYGLHHRFYLHLNTSALAC